jgi:hypothetical protein
MHGAAMKPVILDVTSLLGNGTGEAEQDASFLWRLSLTLLLGQQWHLAALRRPVDFWHKFVGRV